jgi:hypothetical protein
MEWIYAIPDLIKGFKSEYYFSKNEEYRNPGNYNFQTHATLKSFAKFYTAGCYLLDHFKKIDMTLQ